MLWMLSGKHKMHGEHVAYFVQVDIMQKENFATTQYMLMVEE